MVVAAGLTDSCRPKGNSIHPDPIADVLPVQPHRPIVDVGVWRKRSALVIGSRERLYEGLRLRGVALADPDHGRIALDDDRIQVPVKLLSSTAEADLRALGLEVTLLPVDTDEPAWIRDAFGEP